MPFVSGAVVAKDNKSEAVTAPASIRDDVVNVEEDDDEGTEEVSVPSSGAGARPDTKSLENGVIHLLNDDKSIIATQNRKVMFNVEDLINQVSEQNVIVRKGTEVKAFSSVNLCLFVGISFITGHFQNFARQLIQSN